ncbi:MAG: hypothetical protein LBJ13_01415 [Puniceicoccales bacterium]|jgi:hypothetical protein|nr:hypothetical protein [Puniceicoccales bacterium]
MKNLIQKFFFGAALMGQCSVYSEFESLKKRSPFGDAAPLPIVKPQPKVAEPIKPPPLPPPPPQPKKPDLKIEFSAYLKCGKNEFFAISDKTSKDPVSQVLGIHTRSPLGYEAANYNDGIQELEVKIDGHSYLCLLGATDKKTNTGTNLTTNNMNNTNTSPYGSSGNYNYDPSFAYDDFDWDGLDDEFDFDWWNDLGENNL